MPTKGETKEEGSLISLENQRYEAVPLKWVPERDTKVAAYPWAMKSTLASSSGQTLIRA